MMDNLELVIEVSTELSKFFIPLGVAFAIAPPVSTALEMYKRGEINTIMDGVRYLFDVAKSVDMSDLTLSRYGLFSKYPHLQRHLKYH